MKQTQIQSIHAARKAAVKEIKALIKPHLWESGYLKSSKDGEDRKFERIFAFSAQGPDEDNYRIVTAILDQNLRILEGFTMQGTIDCVGGGMAINFWNGWPVEDLLALVAWMRKNFAREVEKVKRNCLDGIIK